LRCGDRRTFQFERGTVMATTVQARVGDYLLLSNGWVESIGLSGEPDPRALSDVRASIRKKGPGVKPTGAILAAGRADELAEAFRRRIREVAGPLTKGGRANRPSEAVTGRLTDGKELLYPAYHDWMAKAKPRWSWLPAWPGLIALFERFAADQRLSGDDKRIFYYLLFRQPYRGR
jgi:hypothetical protein